jgi:CRISPR system Cascade subunit CasD
MMEQKEILALFLDAPLQSWGYQSRFDRRTTLSWPTRSGVVGMMAAAMGIARGDREGLSRFQSLRMTTLFMEPEDEGKREPGSRLMDFHTVGGGYDAKTERHYMPRKAGGGTPATVVSRREYLQDAKFGVLLSGLSEILKKIGSALDNPKWGIFLGRKSCIPASPVCQGRFSEAEAAIKRLEEISGWKVRRTIREVRSFKEGRNTLMDIPVDFEKRLFSPRFIRDEFSF